LPTDVQKNAKTYGVPGARARIAGLLRALMPLLIAVFAAGFICGLIIPFRHVSPVFIGAVLLVLAFFLFVANTVYAARISAFFKGARGEDQVAGLLAALPAGYHVFHSINCTGRILMAKNGDIDHLVVGPTGLFVIETKCWRGGIVVEKGLIYVDGRLPHRDPISQARESARRFAEYLVGRIEHIPTILPVVCFASDNLDVPQSYIEDVVLCNASKLASVVLQNKAYSLSEHEVAALANQITQLI